MWSFPTRLESSGLVSADVDRVSDLEWVRHRRTLGLVHSGQRLPDLSLDQLQGSQSGLQVGGSGIRVNTRS